MSGFDNIVDQVDLPEELWEKVSCPLCGSDEIVGQRYGVGPATLLKKEGWKPSVFPVAYIVQYVLCPCGLMYMNPRMTEDIYREFYISGTYDEVTGRNKEGETETQSTRADRIMRLILETVEKPPILAMDVGASFGTLLDKIKEQFNCKTVGVDLCPIGETEHQWFDTMDEVDLKGRKCDIITCIHTLEHFYDPVGKLEKMGEFLHKKGFIFIEVPNAQTDPSAFRITHPVAFSAGVLVDTALKAGYEIYDMTPAGKNLMVVLMKP
jgi:hypothetical protein